MKYGYEVYPVSDGEATYWIAQSRGFLKKGIGGEGLQTVSGWGKTMEDAIRDLEKKEMKWIKMAEYCSLKIQEPAKKAVSEKRINRTIRGILTLIFICCSLVAGSSVFAGYDLIAGFAASFLFAAVPMELINKIKKRYTSIGYISPTDKYKQYLADLQKDQASG